MKWKSTITLLTVLLMPLFLYKNLLAEQKLSKEEMIENTHKLQVPFMANNGQMDERVKFYANTFGGTVFVTTEGEIVYALPKHKNKEAHGKNEDMVNDAVYRIQNNRMSCLVDHDNKSKIQNQNPEFQNLKSEISGIVLKEEFVGARVNAAQGEGKAVTQVNYFKGNDPSKWKTNISTYDIINLGEVYQGIELKLKAYGNNIEKLFCVKPGANPDLIQVQISGAKTIMVNGNGQLVAETEHGSVKFTAPIAYQEIDGKRVEVAVEYRIKESGDRNQGKKFIIQDSKLKMQNQNSEIRNPQLEYGFKVASYNHTKDLIIDPVFLASTFMGGSGNDFSYDLILDTNGTVTVYVVGGTYSTDFPTTSNGYDSSPNGSGDVFVSKLDSNLTSLLASTYLGGAGYDYGLAITLDTDGNVYVSGVTYSTNFPTTTGTYDTSSNGSSGSSDVFVSKLSSDLEGLLASTYLGGSNADFGIAQTLDTGGNIYVTGYTSSSDFPTTSGVYNTAFKGDSYDVFVSKLNSGLTSLLASTSLGGSGNDYGHAITLGTSGNIYVAGLSNSIDFPTTSDAYDTTLNGSDYDVFVSKMDSGLTSLLASTYLGGSSSDKGTAITLDKSGNVYVAGYTSSSDFPTTSDGYDTSQNGSTDGFVSEFDSGLASLLASTYLGGAGYDYCSALTLRGNGYVYVAGYTSSTDFPTTSDGYDTSQNGSTDIFVSDFNGGLTSLSTSTYLGGSASEQGTAIDIYDAIYVTGHTWSTDFPTSGSAYSPSYNGGTPDVFISKFYSTLVVNSFFPKPTVTTGSATNVTSNSATLNGTVKARSSSATAWFNYGITSGLYMGTSTTLSVSGSNDTSVSSDISGLLSNTTYYYRIAAQNSEGTSYGSETSFSTTGSSATPTPTPKPSGTDTTAPSGSVNINSGSAYTNSTSVTLTLSATDSVGVTAYYLSTSSSTPTASGSAWNTVTSATSYSGSVSYTLTSGDEQKMVYVWFKDAAGNVSSLESDSITLDTTAPIVTFTSPTSDSYTTTSSTVSLEGSALDSTSGVKEVTWSNDKGGSGTASGTTYWSISSISLSSGENKITVTAKDNAGNASTDTITVTYSAATKPTVTTGSTSNVTATSATLTGTVNANGLSTTAWFEYGTVQGTYGSKSSTQTVTGSNDTTVSSTITGLTAETTYYYRIAAQNSVGTSYGSEMSFIYSAECGVPTVTTESATNVTSATAVLNGTVNANSFSTTAWFEYGKQSGVYGSKSDTKAVTGSTDTKVSISVKNLTSGTTYYFRIVAQNCGGTTYGEEMSFYYTTTTDAPTVETESATNVTVTSATLNGKCNPNGLSTTAWFEYGTLSGTYQYKTDTQSLSGSSYTSVSATITGLTAGTTYYYRIAAKNSAGTSYGEEMESYKSPGGSGGVFGYVNDPHDDALQGVEVTITGPSSNNTETDESGYYEFGGLSKGNYTLTYKKNGYTTETKSVSLGEGEVKNLGTITLEEKLAGSIYGYVVDTNGDPIESVQLNLRGVKTKVENTSSTDMDGFFEFNDLEGGTYIIVTQKKRYRKTQRKISLDEGESKEIEIEMRKKGKGKRIATGSGVSE